jgi:hypothetical protein
VLCLVLALSPKKLTISSEMPILQAVIQTKRKKTLPKLVL